MSKLLNAANKALEDLKHGRSEGTYITAIDKAIVALTRAVEEEETREIYSRS